MSTRTFGALSLVAACALTSSALAQEAAQESGAVTIPAETTPPPPSEPRAAPRSGVSNWRIFGGLHFGFLGKLDVDVDTGFGLVTPRPPDLDPTIGLQAGVDYILMDYFALGGELRFSWWKPERNITLTSQSDPDRSLYVDIDIKPRGRYVLPNIPLEVYGTLPLGLTIASVNDSIPMDGGPGFNLGFGAGATYFITPRVGVNMELLGVWHWFDGALDVGPDTDNRTVQLYWVLNAVFAI